jgi:hypothetical protein
VTKEERQEYFRVYYREHKEHINELGRRWYQLNKEYSKKKRRENYNRKNKPSQALYSVWNNDTDELIILDGTARQCADAMGISFKSFHSTRTRLKQGKLKKWTIEISEETENDR